MFKKICLLMSVMLIVFSVLSMSVQAQENEEDIKETDFERVTELDQVVVTATKSAEKRKDVPVNVEVITRDQIENSSADTVADLLATKVTGHVHRYSGLAQSAGLRGFRSDSHGDDIKGYVLVLVDGHRIGTGNMSKISTDAIERIEIIKGPASSLYGSAAMGGVINIITKKGKSEIKHEVTIENGSFNYKNNSVSSSGMITDWMSYFITASYNSIGDYVTKDYGTVYNSSVMKKQFHGNILVYPSENQELRIGFAYNDLEAQSPSWLPDPVSTWKTLTYTSYDRTKKNYTDKSHGYGDLEYNLALFNSTIHWKALGYYLFDRNQWFSGDPSSGDKIEDTFTKYEDTTFGTDQQFTLSLLENHKIVIGYTSEFLRKKAWKEESNVEQIPYTPGMQYMTNSLYLQDSISLYGNNFNVIIGSRIDRFDVKTKRAETGAYTTFNEKNETYYNFSPKVGFACKIVDMFRIRANVGHGFKTPSADEMSAEYEHGTTKIFGNPDLEPETSITYEYGVDIYSEVFSFFSTYSFTRVENMIEKTSETFIHNGTPGWKTYENKGKTELESIDNSIKFLVGSFLNLPFQLDFTSNLTFNLKYKNLDPGVGEDDDLKYISKFEAKSSVLFGINKFCLTLTNVYIGKQKIDNWDTYAVEEKDPFYFYNLSLKWQIEKYLKLTASVQNLTNKNYEWVRGYPMAERNYKVGLTGIL